MSSMEQYYSTIQQHQPLRTPPEWGKGGKAFIMQLEDVLDDIYRRFGRLRMEDLSKSFRKQIEDDEGNIAELIMDVGQIVIDVGNKYDKISGITISTDGIDISGSKYLKLESGCELELKTGGTFTVQSGQFAIDSDGNATFAGTMSAACITSGTMSADRISGGTIDASNVTINNLDASKITTGTMSANKINGGTIDATNVTINNLDASKITSGTIDASNVTITNLNASNITSGTMSANKISGGTIDASNVTINNLDASKITTGTMSASKISGGTLELGGSGNASGVLKVKNASGTVIGTWDKDGISASTGTFSGTLNAAGGTFRGDLEAADGTFKVSSGNKNIKAGNWNLNNEGLDYFYKDEYNNEYDCSFGKVIENNYRSKGIELIDTSQIGNQQVSVYCRQDLFGSGTFATRRVNFKFPQGSSGNNYYSSIFIQPDMEDDTSLGNATIYWESAYLRNIYYANLYQNSSKEIKKEIRPIPDVGEKLDALVPVTFVYDNDPNEKVRAGLIYEDTEGVMPEICTGDEGNKAINYLELIPMLLKEIQGLRARVAALEGGN